MQVDLNSEVTDEITRKSIEADIKAFQEYIDELIHTKEPTGVFSFDYLEELTELMRMKEASKQYLKWYT